MSSSREWEPPSTDGFHNLVLPEQIIGELQNSTELKATADSLVKLALRGGGMDDITLVMAKYLPDSGRP